MNTRHCLVRTEAERRPSPPLILNKGQRKMYLISIYFDKESEKRIRNYMREIGKVTGNTMMLDGNVPPHITVAAFEAESEDTAREIFLHGAKNVKAGEVQWVSIGTFLPGVIYITPVLNKYLQELSETFHEEVSKTQGVRVNQKYLPYHWLPHSTLAKRLSREQLVTAFMTMQNQFSPLVGKVTQIGLAKTNPYTDLEIVELE